MGASLTPVGAATLSRTDKLLCRLDKSMKILEIGPSYNPIAPKAEGWNCFTIDHESQENLRAKYAVHPVDISRIEPVDFIWRDGPLDAVIPEEHMGTFDACIASHVIEHFPNPVQVLRSLQRILKKDGRVSLAVPDKRFCFDYFKPLTMTGDLLSADFRHATRHSRRTAFDHTAYSVYTTAEIGAWGQHPVTEMRLMHTLAEAKKHLDDYSESPEDPYEDHHAWHYTPASFRLAILELGALDVLDWTEDVLFPAVGCEFIVTLKRGKAGFPSEKALEQRRLELLLETIRDLKEQCDYLQIGKQTGELAVVPAVGTKAVSEDRLAQVLQQQAELMRRMDQQDRQIRKIWKVARLLKTASRPVRAVGRASADAYGRSGDLWRGAAEKIRSIWR